MFKSKILLIIVILELLLSSVGQASPGKQPWINIPVCQPIVTINQAANIFPESRQDVETWTKTIIQATQKAVKAILSISDANRTFANTIRPFDAIQNSLNNFYDLCVLMIKVHPSSSIKNSCITAGNTTAALLIDLTSNQKIFKTFQDYHAHLSETLTNEEYLFLETTIKNFIRNGAHLDTKTLNNIQALRLKLDTQKTTDNTLELSQTFSLSQAELAGVSQKTLSKLPYNKGFYSLTLCPQQLHDLSMYRQIMIECSVEETRKKIFAALNTHKLSYIDHSLKAFAQEKNKLAGMTGYENAAAFALENSIAKSPQAVENFLTTIIQQCVKQGQEELALIKRTLPGSIQLNNKDTINPWDYDAARNAYLLKNCYVNHHTITEHLPLKHVLTKMFSVFGSFFGLKFIEVHPYSRWHDAVHVIEVYDTSNHNSLGYLYLDLLARDEKDGTSCCISLNNNLSRSVTVIIKNFNVTNEHQLLKHHDVVSLFHEFGHAMHAMIASPSLACHASLRSSTDFLEFPSQLFEEWAYHGPTLTSISSHYQTKKPLDSCTTSALTKFYETDAWNRLLLRCMRALFTLKLFTETDNYAHSYLLWKSLQKQYIPDRCLRTNLFWYYGTHQEAYDRLYGPQYYGYTWSKQYAQEVFEIIKQAGVLYSTVGKRLKDTIFTHGSGRNPEELLQHFLGR